MIKYSELRSGNYICHSNGNILKVNFHHIRYLTINPETVDYKPIQLTEELLLKCGFEKNFEWTCSIYIKGNYKLVYYVGEKGWSIGFKNYSDYSNLNYLHQLQNLYWCLVGGELNISL